MDSSALQQAIAQIEGDPRSGQSLLLYALAKTLTVPQGGHAYLLTKLKEMTPASRQIAYGLMELMAQGGSASAAWQEAGVRMDRAIGGKA